MKLTCYFDGACEPRNPGGNMGIGALVKMDDVVLWDHSSFVPAKYSNSNNVAEYLAFEKIIDYLTDLQDDFKGYEVTIHGDSMLVICQMQEQWRIKNGRYVEYAKRCRVKLKLLREYMTVRLGWIRRTENTLADELSKGELVRNNVEFKIQPLKVLLLCLFLGLFSCKQSTIQDPVPCDCQREKTLAYKRGMLEKEIEIKTRIGEHMDGEIAIKNSAMEELKNVTTEEEKYRILYSVLVKMDSLNTKLEANYYDR